MIATAEKAFDGWILESIELMPVGQHAGIEQGEIDGFTSLAVTAKVPIGSVQRLAVAFVYRQTQHSCTAKLMRDLMLEP